MEIQQKITDSKGKNLDMQLFFSALGLVFVFEGLLPFLAPRIWRRMMQNMMMQDDKVLRVFGLVSMLVGLATLYINLVGIA